MVGVSVGEAVGVGVVVVGVDSVGARLGVNVDQPLLLAEDNESGIEMHANSRIRGRAFMHARIAHEEYHGRKDVHDNELCRSRIRFQRRGWELTPVVRHCEYHWSSL